MKAWSTMPCSPESQGGRITDCSCTVIYRRLLYLKLTIPAGIDIPVRCVDGLHFNDWTQSQGSATRPHIRFWPESDVVLLHRFHELPCHAVTLRAAHRCCTALQIQLHLELPCAEPLFVSHCTSLSASLLPKNFSTDQINISCMITLS